MFHGDSIQLVPLADRSLVELRFDRRGEAVNKFDRRTVGELREAVQVLARAPGLRGVLVTSAKASFIVGADIGEFEQRFQMSEDELALELWRDNEVFMAFEDLGVPSVAAIDGHALGGGCELALAAVYRVMAQGASIGVPEVKLGLFPGLGGTVRLPRVGGIAVAVDWIVGGRSHGADAARATGIVDAVCLPAALRDTALDWLHRAAAGELDWRTRQAAKRAPVPMPLAELEAFFRTAAERLATDGTPPGRPAAAMAVALMGQATQLPRDAAQWLECTAFARVARTQAGRALVQAFLNAQSLKRINRRWGRGSTHVLRVAYAGPLPEVLSPDGKASLVRTDVAQAELILVTELDTLPALGEQAAEGACLACVGARGPVDAWVAGMRRPAAVVGLDVHGSAGRPGLVEVRRGGATSDAAVGTAVAWALAMRGTPIVVRGDGLVERVLAPFRRALRRLAEDAGPERVRRALSGFGWDLGIADSAALRKPPSAVSRLTDAEIIERLMLPLVIAAAAALEDGAVGSTAELDTAVQLAAGLPAHVGGPLQYADWLGAAEVIAACERHPSLGPDGRPTPGMRRLSTTGGRYCAALHPSSESRP